MRLWHTARRSTLRLKPTVLWPKDSNLKTLCSSALQPSKIYWDHPLIHNISCHSFASKVPPCIVGDTMYPCMRFKAVRKPNCMRRTAATKFPSALQVQEVCCSTSYPLVNSTWICVYTKVSEKRQNNRKLQRI